MAALITVWVLLGVGPHAPMFATEHACILAQRTAKQGVCVPMQRRIS